jgi:hypothetical protein
MDGGKLMAVNVFSRGSEHAWKAPKNYKSRKRLRFLIKTVVISVAPIV